LDACIELAASSLVITGRHQAPDEELLERLFERVRRHEAHGERHRLLCLA